MAIEETKPAGIRPARRAVLALGAAAAGAAVAPRALFAGSPVKEAPSSLARFVTAARIGGVDRGAVLQAEGISDFALPGRAHASLALPGGRIMLVGRRPGMFAAIAEDVSGGAVQFVRPFDSHRFAGHAALGAHLVTAELHEETSEGLAVLRDAHSGAIRGSWQLDGIEPHEMIFADGGARLVIALGGIAKSATIKGPPINAGHIESAVVELDAASGRVLHRHVLPMEYASLSLRHMALAPDGKTIAVGIQDQDRSALRPLVALLRVGRGLELLPAPEGGVMRFYIGSIAIDAGGDYIAATSPKGGCLALWSLSRGTALGHVAIEDVCGLTAAAEPGVFCATSGLGEVVRVQADENGPSIVARWHAGANFDNHLLRI